MKRFVYFIVAFIFIIGYYSCQNDDFPNSEEKEQMESLIPKGENNDVVIPDSIVKMMVTQDVLATFCHVDTINDSTFTYRSKYGYQDETNPSTYLFKSTGDKDAYSFFMHLIPYKERDKILEIGNSFSYSIDHERTIKYTYIGSSEMKAMIEFEIPEIPEIKRYIYLPVELWPYNDSSSPFSLGSVWQRVDGNDTKTKYVCVKEYCGRNDPGILMTFERGWSVYGVGGYYYNMHELPYKCASKWAWQKLEDLYSDYNMLFNDAKNEGAIPDNIPYGGYWYNIGSPSCRTWTTGWWFWKENHFEATFEWVYFKNGKFHFLSTSWNSGVKYCTGMGSSHIEFGNTMPSGKWEQISF